MVDAQGYEDVERMRQMFKDGATKSTAAAARDLSAQSSTNQIASEYDEALPVNIESYDLSAHGDLSGVLTAMCSSTKPKRSSVKQKRSSVKHRSPQLPPKNMPKLPPKNVPKLPPKTNNPTAAPATLFTADGNTRSHSNSESAQTSSPRIAPRPPERRRKTDLGLPLKAAQRHTDAFGASEENLPPLPPKGM